MARHRDEYEDEEDEEEELEEEEDDDEEEYGGKSGRKRRRSEFIDDAAVEDDDEDEDDEEEETGRRGGSKHRRASAMDFIDAEAQVDTDDEEEEEEEEDGFIVEGGTDLQDEDDNRRMHRRPSILDQQEDQLDVDELSQQIRERYARSSHIEYGDDATEVEQQALLPSVKDPKLWMIKCQIGREREAVICLMQKYIDKGSQLQIKSAVALDHLKNYIYVEAEKESHVREACNGLRSIFPQKVQLVPIKEMTDVLSVESKIVDLATDAWVRMKLGIYKGDLAKVVEVDNVRQKVTVKLIPRIDLQAIADKMDGNVVKKKPFVPPPRFFNIDEAREMHIRVERRRFGGVNYEFIDNMKFRDGFHYKTVSLKSVSTQSIQPTFEELEKFRAPGEDADGDVGSLSTLFANRKKGHFMKGDAVVVVKGELKNLMGWVEKVEEENVHVRPSLKGLPETLAFNAKELCKYFKAGDHVKVVSGDQEGATGMVVKVEGHVLIIVSDTTNEHIRVFADHVVESSEVTAGVTKIGNYELHDLVSLNNKSFGVIIRVEKDACRVLKGVPDRPEAILVKPNEITGKLDRRTNAQDRYKNIVSAKDVVRVVEGPSKGRQGPVEHIHSGILFIYDRHHLEHAGYICAKSHSCVLVGGSRDNRDRNNGSLDSRFGSLRPNPVVQSPMRSQRPPSSSGFGGRHGGRGHDALVGRVIKIRLGPFKGYRGRVKEVKGTLIRVELDSQMKIVTVNRDQIADTSSVATPARESNRYSMGSETPMHPSRTPLHPYMTPMRDPGATPIHDGMRTPMRDRAWNPYAPMSPPRDNWDDANPSTWGTSPQYQPGSPAGRLNDAPTPSAWANTPGGNYADAGTPRDGGIPYGNAPSPYVPSTPGQPMTPSSMAYLPSTPGGLPMTPGNVGLDVMSPTIGGEGGDTWLMPDVLVNVQRPGDDPQIGVVREVLTDGTCRVALGSSGNGQTVTAGPSDLEMVAPKKSDKIKIMSGGLRGLTGKLIGIDGSDGIVKLDETLDVKILDMVILAKLSVQ